MLLVLTVLCDLDSFLLVCFSINDTLNNEIWFLFISSIWCIAVDLTIIWRFEQLLACCIWCQLPKLVSQFYWTNDLLVYCMCCVKYYHLKMSILKIVFWTTFVGVSFNSQWRVSTWSRTKTNKKIYIFFFHLISNSILFNNFVD